MSSVFKKFKKSIDKSVATVSVKSNTLLEINKIKLHMDSLREKIISKKVELGETVYNLYIDGVPYNTVVETICEEVKDLNAQIVEKEKEIEATKEQEEAILGSAERDNTCECGKEIPEGHGFCTHCGKKAE